MTDPIVYSVIEPNIEFIDPGLDYLKKIELAARTCHKSEDYIKEKSAEKLLSKIVFKLGHESVIEHVDCIMYLQCPDPERVLIQIMGADWGSVNRSLSRGLFGVRASIIPRAPDQRGLYLSGNLRQWLHLYNEFLVERLDDTLFNAVACLLGRKWPFFFEAEADRAADLRGTWLLDENPLTNTAQLGQNEMLRHMSLTYRIVGDRAMSHQLVRHRLAAFSQESQRYCNYGKKGFQFLVPPAYEEFKDLKAGYINVMDDEYCFYLAALEAGVNPEDARRPLGNATKTEVFTTFTLEQWKHFHQMRTNNDHAEWCIRGLGQQILEHQKQILPDIFA